jgi:hypothetical protein
LAPAGMIEQWAVHALEPQKKTQSDGNQHAERPQRPPLLIQRQLTCLNVQYLFRKKFTTMPASVAMNQVL